MGSTKVGDARITFIKALYSEKMGHRVVHVVHRVGNNYTIYESSYHN